MTSKQLTKLAVANRIDYRDAGFLPEVFDQEGRHTCTAQVVSALIYFHLNSRNTTTSKLPSRLFIYYNACCQNGTPPSDFFNADKKNGLPIGMCACLEAVTKLGWCAEVEWPHKADNWLHSPPPNCYKNALANAGLKFERLDKNIDLLIKSIADDRPFIFGLYLYSSFYEKNTIQSGQISIPKTNEAKRGAHALMAVGYDLNEQYFIVRHSAGDQWGDRGYGYLPFEYIGYRTGDFWRIQ